MCLASAYRLRFRLLPHARRLSVLTTTLRSPMPVGSFHGAFALRFYSHETWLDPPYLWTNVRTNRHCISTEIARMQLAQVTNKTEIVSAFRRLIYPKILRFSGLQEVVGLRPTLTIYTCWLTRTLHGGLKS